MANTAAVLQLLDERCIRVGVQAADWREAIRCAGDLLEAQGVCTGKYTQAMIDTVVEKGPPPAPAFSSLAMWLYPSSHA